MKLSDKAEEILEHLWIMTQEMGQDIVSLKEIKTAGDAPEVKELLSLKYINVSNDGISLKERGNEGG